MASTNDVSRKRRKLRNCSPGYSEKGEINDLNEAITTHRAALELPPLENDKCDRLELLHRLALCLWRRYSKLEAVEDLEEAITLRRAVLELCPPGHSKRGLYISNLARLLRRRFAKKAAICDLDEAIELHRAALELCPSGHPDRHSSLNQLAYCLSNRHSKNGVAGDLEEAITLGRAALELCSPGHSNHGLYLSNLACCLRRRFAKKAAVCDLEEAIELHRAALDLRPSGHPDRHLSINQLAYCLSNRHDKNGVADDLEEAITLGHAALELRPPGHSDRGVSLYNLACDLSKRFSKQAAVCDLEEAIELHRAALELRPHGHPDRPSSLHELSFCLSNRYGNHWIADDSNETITFGRTALELRPPGHPDHDTADLDEAIVLDREALQLLVPADPRYNISRQRLITHLQMKIRSQSAIPPSNALPVSHFDVKQIIRNVAFEILKAMPTRLLHTHTGMLCNRDAQLSHFMGSEQCDQLLSSCTTCDPAQRMKLIHAEVSRYFRFVMLSHCWGEVEPSLHDIEGHSIYVLPTNAGLRKLQAYCAVSCERDYLWAWSDTCCIDKDNSAELQESIGSMFSWYRRSSLTIVYLSDVPDIGALASSQWFGRGWALQELLAPRSILFYTQGWSLYKNLKSSNHKADVAVLEELERVTGIESRFLTSFSPSMDDVRSRLQWASLRRTTRPEDIAYSLFGIFDIDLPILYGESAESALGRLLTEIISRSGDISVLDWVGEASWFHSCFPAQLTSYRTLPLPSLQPNAEEHTSIMSEQPAVSAALQTLYCTLVKSSLPRFVAHRLALPCIAHRVTAIQLKGPSSCTPTYSYEIQAFGLKSLEVTLPRQLESAAMSQGALQLVRPWHSKLLDPYTKDYARTEEQLLHTLGRPFRALLLIEQPHNEYRRIASSAPIIAQPIGSTSIVESDVRIFDIV